MPPIGVAAPLETELAINHGRYLGFHEELDADVFLHEGVIHLTDPQEKHMLDPQDPFRVHASDCGYRPRTEPQDFCSEDLKVDCGLEESCAACDPIENQGFDLDMRVSDVSAYEVAREYVYDDGVIQIKNPWRVFIAASGTHRVQTEDGTVNYIPAGWRLLRWTPRDVHNPVKF